jgi:hypothetical protein
MDKMNMNVPLCKVKTTENGGREIYGFATTEVKDKSGEIADAEGTLKAFGVWSNEISKRTNGVSKGNLRLMHSPVTAGRLISYQPSEANVPDQNGDIKAVKAIYIGAYVPPTKTDIISDIDEGILNSFSIAGNYAKRWYDNAAKAFRFIPQLAEISIVDNPCCPGSDFTSVINKADGPWNKDNSKLNKEAERLMSKEAKEIVEKAIEEPVEKAVKEPVEKAVKEPVKKGIVTKADLAAKAKELAKAKVAKAADDSADTTAADDTDDDGDDSDNDAACKALGISKDQFKVLKGMFKKDALQTQTPVIPATTSLDGTAGTFGQGGLSLDVAGAAADIQAAENATFKTVIAEMKKGIQALEDQDKAITKGVSISKSRAINLLHAKNHINAAVNGTSYGPGAHEVAEGKDPSTESACCSDDASKVAMGSLQKGIDEVSKFSKSVNATILGSQNKIEALFKGMTSQEDFKKMSDSLEAVSVLVKEIHETPVNNNTILNGGAPDVLKMLKGQSNNNLGSTDDTVLQKFMGETKDPMLKDKIGQEIAMRRMKQNMSNQGAR